MPKLTKEAIEKDKNSLMAILGNCNSSYIITSHLAKEIGRDEEYVLKLLLELEKDGIVRKTSNEDKRKFRKKWGIRDEKKTTKQN